MSSSSAEEVPTKKPKIETELVDAVSKQRIKAGESEKIY